MMQFVSLPPRSRCSRLVDSHFSGILPQLQANIIPRMPEDNSIPEVTLALQDPFFIECLSVSADNKELVKEFDRLTGFNLSLKGSPITIAVDSSTGFLDEGLREFVKFVYECVYLRCQR